MNILRLSDLSSADVRAIWGRAGSSSASLAGTVAWSFEGKGTRTRTTFVQAFRELGLSFTELPDMLKSPERPSDLAGYLDPFYRLYVVREMDHQRLAEFAAASSRPVINAMSSEGHPCEVLADAYFIESSLMPIDRARIVLWGPPTNVLRSWHELAGALGITVRHVCESRFHEAKDGVTFTESADGAADVVITDGWPTGIDAPRWSLTNTHLARMGHPKLLPTPPFSIGRELSVDPAIYPGFVGYEQKRMLVPVQKAILCHAAEG